jgi:hypothetical protein
MMVADAEGGNGKFSEKEIYSFRFLIQHINWNDYSLEITSKPVS